MTAGIALLVLVPLGFAAVVGGAIAIIVHQVRARHRRADEMSAWAEARGWTLLKTDPTVAGLACPPVERGGRSRWVTRGVDDDGHAVVVFEWSHWESSGSSRFDDDGASSRSEVLTTVVASTVPGVHPMIQVSPGRPRRGLFGGRPDPRTVVTGVPGFDAHCTMITDDPLHAARVLPQPVLARWAADPQMAATGFRLNGEWLVCWQSGGVGLDRLDRGLAVLGELRANIGRAQTPA